MAYDRFASAIRCYCSGEDVQVSKSDASGALETDDLQGLGVISVSNSWLGLEKVHRLTRGANLCTRWVCYVSAWRG